MIGQQYSVLLVCFLLFFSACQATGVLHVDTVYSSSESKIVVDNMSGVLGETGHAETHEVEFSNFAGLAISAPQLDFHGSYFSVQTINDAVFTSTDDSISVVAGHNMDVNAVYIDIIAHFIDIESVGEILLLAREEVSVSSENTALFSGDGGASFSSLAGDVSVSSPNDITFDAFDALSLRATNDLSLISTGNGIFTGDNMYLFSDNTASIDSSSSISMVSSVSSVKFDSHDLSLTLGSMGAVGGGQALLQSFGDELNVYGFTGVTMTSFGDINVAGASDGATFIATGDSGAVIFASEAGSATFIAEGSSGHASTHLAADSIYTNVQDFQITSNSDTHVTGDRNVLVDSPSVAFDVRRDAFLFNERKLSFSAGTSFGITADLLALTTEDSAVNMSALLVETKVGNHLSMTSNNFLFAADNSDFVIAAGSDISIKADFTNGRRQEINLSATSFTVSQADLDIIGGHVTLAAGDDFNFSANSDFTINSDEEKVSSEVVVSAGSDLSMSLSSWRHNTGNVLFTNDNILLFSTAQFNFNDITLSTNGKNDINVYSTSNSFLSALDDFEINVGRDFVAALEDDWDVNAQVNDVTMNTSDFYASADTFNAEVQIGQTIQFLSAQDTIITTHRNENTDEELSFEFTDDVSVSADNIYLSTTADGVISAGATVTASSNEFTLNSGTLNDITMNADFFEFNVAEALMLNGNSLLFDSALDFTLNGDGGAIDFTAAYHGVDMYSEGTFDFESASFTVNTKDEILVWSGADMSVTAETVIVSGSESNWVHVKTGDLVLNAFGDITTHSSRNMTLSTGDHNGDTFLQTSDLATISANDLFAMNIEESLTAHAIGGIIRFDASSFTMDANMAINMESPIFTAVGDVVVIEGGDMTYTTASSTFTSSQSSSFSSFAGSHSNGVFDDNNDYFLLQSMLGSITTSNTGAFTQFISTGDISFDSAGIFLLNAGNNIFVQSKGENQDVYLSTTGGDISLSSLANSNFRADGDLWMTATDGIVFNQKDFDIEIFDDLSVTAEDASINIINDGTSVFGVLLLAGDLQLIDVSRDNTLSATSTMESTYTSHGGISIISDGSAESRRETAGDSNAHQHIDQLVGFSARTYQPEAHIIFDARSSPISWSASNGHMFLDTAAWMTIETLNEQSYTAGETFSMESEDGAIVFSGATGIDIDGDSRDTFFLSYGYTDATAKQNILMTGNDDFDVTSYHSDIQVTTFTAGDITSTATRFTTFQAGLALDVFAQGDMSFTSGDEFDLVAERGYSLEASGDLISFTSTTDGNVIDSSEEIYILAGGDLTMSNPGPNLENMKFEAASAVFTSTGGDMSFTTEGLLTFDMEQMLVNAFGTSAGKRDHIQFTAPDITMTAETRGIFVDATEEMLFGTAAVPTIMSLTATDHIAVSSVGNVGLTTDNIYNVIADSFQSDSVAETDFKAGGTFEVNSASGSITFNTDILSPSGEQIVDGAINFSVAGDFTNTVSGAVSLEALHQNSWDANLMTWTVGTNLNVNSAASISQTVGQDLLLTSVNFGIVFKVNPGDGEMHADIANDLFLDAALEIEFDAGDYINFAYDGAIAFLPINSAKIIITGGESSIYLDSLESMNIEANNINMEAISMSTVSGENNLEIFSAETITIFSTNFWASAEADFNVNVAVDANFDLDEVLQIFSDNDIYFETVGNMDFFTSSVQMITLPGGGGDIDFEATAGFTITTDNKISMNGDSQIEFNTADAVFTAARDLNIFAAGERADLNFDANSMTSTAGNYIFTSGDDGTSGDIIFQGTSAVITTNNLSFLADASEVAATSSVEFDFDTNFALSTGFDVNFEALSDNEGQQGTIAFDGDSSFVAVSDMNFLAEESSIEFFGSNVNIALGGEFSMNTHGYDAGIDITTPSLISPTFGGPVTINAGDSVELILERHSEANLVTGAANLGTVGPAAKGTFGAKFTSSAVDGGISVTANGGAVDFRVNFGDLSALATDDLFLLANAASIFQSLNANEDLKIIAQGSRVSQSLVQPHPTTTNEGLFISSQTTIGVVSVVDDISIEASHTLEMLSDQGVVFQTGNTPAVFSSTGDIELNFGATSLINAANTITMESEYGGIQLFDPNSMIIAATNDILVNGGTGFDDSLITFTAGSGNMAMSFTISELTVEADANIMVTAYDSTTFNANDVLFEATTGDILFRSITAEGAGDGPFDLTVVAGDELTITAFERIEHRQHRNLAYFDTPNQPSRSATEAPQQSTVIPAFAGAARPNGCFCTTTNAGGCTLECPDTTNRILQMQRAFIDYGLLAI